MTKCPYCGSDVMLKDATFIYHRSQAKRWGKVWVCKNYPKCDAYVGCHEGTTLPLGRPANARLRTLKAEAHKQFDVKMCQKVIQLCKKQDNKVINEYRKKEYKKQPVFTRGYDRKKHK